MFFWTISDPKPRIAEKEPEEEIIIKTIEADELWTYALEEFDFSAEELDAIGSRLVLVPKWAMFPNGASYDNIELDRYHFMDMRAKDLKLEDKKNHIRNKCKYLIKVLENNFIPKEG